MVWVPLSWFITQRRTMSATTSNKRTAFGGAVVPGAKGLLTADVTATSGRQGDLASFGANRRCWASCARTRLRVLWRRGWLSSKPSSSRPRWTPRRPLAALVIVLGFSHRTFLDGALLLSGDSFTTPIATSRSTPRAARSRRRVQWPHVLGVARTKRAQRREPDPVRPSRGPGARLVVGLVVSVPPMFWWTVVACKTVAAAKGERVLVVASSDMLHSPDWELVKREDAKTLALMQKMDWRGLSRAWGPGKQILSGIQPVLALIQYAERPARPMAWSSSTRTAETTTQSAG